MDKKILVISGNSESKFRFGESARDSQFNIQNINPNGMLTSIAQLAGWNGEKDENYYDFCIELGDILNNYFDFKRKIVLEKIDRFLNGSSKLLVIHGCENERALITELREKYGAKTLHIYEERPLVEDNKFDYILVDDPSFEDGIKNILD
jgi:hypothetical protein